MHHEKEQSEEVLPEYPLVSVLVPTWNSEKEICDFLDALAVQSYPKSSIELVIIDNGSTDRSTKVVRDWYGAQQSAGWHRLQLIALPINSGIAHAYNLGYEKSSPAAFAILRGEADVVLEPPVVEKLCAVLAQDASIAVAGAKGLFYGSVPPKLDHAASYVNWWTGKVRCVDPPRLVDCDSVLGPTFLTRRECIGRMQFFFAADRFLADELEFCTRVKRFGFRVVCEPDAVSHHKSARSSSQLNRARFGYIAQRETVLFYLKYNSFPQNIVWLVWNAAYGLKQAFKGQTMPLLGLRDGIRWWLLRRPTRLPNAPNGMSLSEWLAGS
jgi:GT2 family glycosyltransferase